MSGAETELMARRRRLQTMLGFGFSWTAGFVDVVGFLALYRVFVANMTGNTIALGAGVSEGDWALALRRGSAIPFFVFGMLVSRLAIHAGRLHRWRRVRLAIHALQSLLLAGFVVLGRHLLSHGQIVAPAEWMYFALIGSLSFAMGLQNAAMRHFGGLTIHTTHVTGTLAKFVDECARLTVGWWHRRFGGSEQIDESHARNRAILLGLIWVWYLAGAGMGAWLLGAWGLDCLWIPIAFLVATIGIELGIRELWRQV